ncbi:hypothetical protein D3C84_909450 [compost metagenome]
MLLVATQEDDLVRDGEMHPGIFHPLQTHNGAGEFTLQASPIAGIFDKLTGAEGGLLFQHIQADG